jgi:hypothetical protein
MIQDIARSNYCFKKVLLFYDLYFLGRVRNHSSTCRRANFLWRLCQQVNFFGFISRSSARRRSRHSSSSVRLLHSSNKKLFPLKSQRLDPLLLFPKRRRPTMHPVAGSLLRNIRGRVSLRRGCAWRAAPCWARGPRAWTGPAARGRRGTWPRPTRPSRGPRPCPCR